MPSTVELLGVSGLTPSPCPHCGTAVEGPPGTYCCHGCELAAEIIREAGLERYYDERLTWAPTPLADSEAERARWAEVSTTEAADGTVTARIGIDGLRCASCVWVNERLLEQQRGVVGVSVSYATGRATLSWDPAQTDLGTLCAGIAAVGYRPRPLHAEATPDHDLLARLGVATFLAANVMLVSVALYIGWWDAVAEPWASFFRWIVLILATPAAVWCAEPFFSGAWRGLRQGVLHMDVPVSLAVVILYGHGVAATLRHTEGYLDSLTMLVALLLVGRVLEARSRKHVAEAVSSLASRLPARARRIVGDAVEEVDPEVLRVDDRVEVGTGEEIPADGLVEQGSAAVQMALLTGESEPQALGPGNRVIAGAVVQSGALRVRITEVGRQTVLQQVAGRLGEALDRSEIPTAADRIAPWFTGATLGVAALTFVLWTWLADPDTALQYTVAVLVVACPCALSLAHPLTAAAGLSAAARRGLLLRSSEALLALAEVDLLAVDKTGTLTRGEPTVVRADDAVLRVAAGLERNSGHPLARAIVAEAVRRGVALPVAIQVVETPGIGIEGEVDGRWWTLRSGSPGAVALLADDDTVAEILLSDVPRADAAASLQALRDLGVDVALITGDRAEIALPIAAAVGVTQVLAAVDPLRKADWVSARRREGRRVLFAGDGVNDGPAITAADVGVAMGSGAASSVLVADGVVSTAALGPLAAGVRAGRATAQTIRSSLARSIAYNVLAVSAAMVGWINPLVAAILMPLSSFVVIWSAARVDRRVG